jgi:hypothetical protein
MEDSPLSITLLAGTANAQSNQLKQFDMAEITKINAWTVGPTAGQLEGAATPVRHRLFTGGR